MTLTPQDARNFLFASDYPVDMVIYKHAESRTLATAGSIGGSVTFTVPHGLPITPLCIGSYSDDNFVTSYSFGSFPYFYNPTYSQFTQRIAAVVESDATNIYIRAINHDAAREFKFRVVGLAPPEIPTNTVIPATNDADPFLLNTDYNYMKIAEQGKIAHTDDGSFGFQTEIVIHGLGYIPTALVFSEYQGRTRLAGAENAIGSAGIDTFVYLNETSLVIETDPFTATTTNFYYKVYLDA